MYLNLHNRDLTSVSELNADITSLPDIDYPTFVHIT